jgi:hypothetical protein
MSERTEGLSNLPPEQMTAHGGVVHGPEDGTNQADRERAAIIRKKAAELNAAIWEADREGLSVSLGIASFMTRSDGPRSNVLTVPSVERSGNPLNGIASVKL